MYNYVKFDIILKTNKTYIIYYIYIIYIIYIIIYSHIDINLKYYFEKELNFNSIITALQLISIL